MDKLDAKSPCAGLLPLSIGTLNVSEMDMGAITSVSPFDGASNSALGGRMGLPFPAPGQTSGNDSRRCVWVGQGEALLMGVQPDAKARMTRWRGWCRSICGYDLLRSAQPRARSWAI